LTTNNEKSLGATAKASRGTIAMAIITSLKITALFIAAGPF
jgi:hypothetical protein